MITTAAQIESNDLAECRWPQGFDRFVVSEVERGTNLAELLEKPWKWQLEFSRFLCGVNTDPIRRNQPIADWLESQCCDWEARAIGGSMERSIEYREIKTGVDGEECNLVGDFTEYNVSDMDQPELVTGAKYEFRGLVTKVLFEATAHVESKHGRTIVVFEVEAIR